MKLRQWLYGTALLAMLPACSENDITKGKGEGGELENPVSGYLAVEIKLPQESVTRAENDNFDDGSANEYAVDNAMIVIFKGNDEMTSKFYKAQDLKRPFLNNMPTNDQIISSYLAAVQVSETTGDIDYWGLVILNRNEDSTAVVEPDENGNETVKIAGQTFSTSNTFEDVLKTVTSNSFMLTRGDDPDSKTYSRFFMTNAPLANAPGGGSDGSGLKSNDFKIQYLANLGHQTYKTIEEARENVKNCIYVERAVAKVTCSQDASSFKLDIVDEAGNSLSDLTVKADVRYALTNTNLRSYVVRNVQFTDKHFSWDLYNGDGGYRMVGEVAMPKLKSPYHEKEQPLYRTYWCIDPNYSDVMKPEDKYIVKTDDEFTDISRPLYCKENTFTVANQNHGNTTLALFRVAFTVEKDGKPYGDGSLYTKGGDESKIYASAMDAASQEITRIKNDPEIIDALKQAAVASGLTEVSDATQYIDVNFGAQDGYLMIESISLRAEDGAFNAAGVAKFNEVIGSVEDDTSIHYDLVGHINAMNEIKYFQGGVSYYTVPIKHFGDRLCPWRETSGTSTEAVYNSNTSFNTDSEDSQHASLYLGRYGMVRNNWYDLHITDIKTLESPTIPEINLVLSDDNKEEKSYIGVQIHILSWAKRTQSMVF